MEKYVFESHLGGIYLLDEYEEPETCEQCGDCDQYIGMAENMEEVATLLLENGYSDYYIEEETGYRVELVKVREVEFK